MAMDYSTVYAQEWELTGTQPLHPSLQHAVHHPESHLAALECLARLAVPPAPLVIVSSTRHNDISVNHMHQMCCKPLGLLCSSSHTACTSFSRFTDDVRFTLNLDKHPLQLLLKSTTCIIFSLTVTVQGATQNLGQNWCTDLATLHHCYIIGVMEHILPSAQWWGMTNVGPWRPSLQHAAHRSMYHRSPMVAHLALLAVLLKPLAISCGEV